MISQVRQNPSYTSFGRDIHDAERQGLMDRNQKTLFDVAFKVGRREIKATDGAIDQLDIWVASRPFKTSPDGRIAVAKGMPGTFLNAVYQVLQLRPPAEKGQLKLENEAMRKIMDNDADAIAKTAFDLGSGALEPEGALQSLKQFKSYACFWTNLPPALDLVQKKSRELYDAAHPVKAFIARHTPAMLKHGV